MLLQGEDGLGTVPHGRDGVGEKMGLRDGLDLGVG
jgi:hypothetical protein